MKAEIVVGLQFGDESKGNFTDYLCTRADRPIVIRFSGGQQAGHTVIHNGVKHVFSNYGSGTLQGVPTYFTEDTSVYLNTMWCEFDVLTELGIVPVLTLHPLTKVTTPYDVAYGCAREESVKHGSCGLGIGSTMNRHENTGYKLYAVDFSNTNVFMAKLDSISKYYENKIKGTNLEESYYKHLGYQLNDFLDIIKHANKMFGIIDYNYLMEFETLIFEGSQGIMLDREHGIFPNVTYSDTTSKNAIKVCKILGLEDEYEVFYITRCYQTRHGEGWMSPTEDIKLINTDEEINVTNNWQGNFKVKEIDYDLLKYAIKVDRIYNNNFYHLVITCLDQRPDFIFDDEKVGDFSEIYRSYSSESTKIDGPYF